ncbi:YdcH family protein [Thioalkalivibrio sp. XN8]|uniref:YdcH family protein n=1 Tax=Thioalkalivibrio sp. XN8 TaxID=2712863 RepID=UPI001F0EBD03|nr:YdcH family protein [Thioalkalivibrio sp. XN8]
MNDNKVDTYIFGNMTRLKELRIAHRDLDDVITRLADDPLVDQLQLKRLKKRKLMLKDLITRLESELIPDLNA